MKRKKAIYKQLDKLRDNNISLIEILELENISLISFKELLVLVDNEVNFYSDLVSEYIYLELGYFAYMGDIENKLL